MCVCVLECCGFLLFVVVVVACVRYSFVGYETRFGSIKF